MSYTTVAEVWTDINNATSVDEITTILQNSNTDGIKLDVNDLKNLALSQSMDTGGKPILLYSGAVNPNFSANDIAKGISNSNSAVAIIDNVDAGRLASNVHFDNAVRLAVDNNPLERNKFFFGDLDTNGNRIGFNGLWDDLSEDFVTQNASGDIKTLTPFSSDNSVFHQTELPALLANSNVDTIDGIPRSTLNNYYNSIKTLGGTDAQALQATNDLIKAKSWEGVQLLKSGLDSNGNIAYDSVLFFSDTSGVNGTPLPSGATQISYLGDSMQHMNTSMWSTLKAGAANDNDEFTTQFKQVA